MSARSPRRLSLFLAVLVLTGLIGMLMAKGALDALFFVLASAPLLIGFVCWTLARRRRRAF
ncbi:MAG: hypothetical protein JNK68_15250 [Betaproteobacteria bacterium]|nr:hypothetical protein [Betaproteobacteria bacterium]